ncbi:MAG TPA: hypothetical protein PK908_03950 [Bacteroidales bacterium]|nr:hypothetical protein [Bacteroidales bacterium]
MNKRFYPYLIVILLISMIWGCKEEEKSKPPVINFKIGEVYTQNNDTVAVGGELFFGIQARSDNSNLTNFTIKKKLPDESMITVMDTAIFTQYLEIDKRLFQNVEPVVTWVFSVMDRERFTAEISLVVYKDPNSKFGGIYHIPSVKLGYQNNTEFGQFLIPSAGKTYGVDSAYLFQNEIDILCYFKNEDNPPGPSLSSPGEMDNFSDDAKKLYPTIIDWQTRNYTLWDISAEGTPIAVEDFNAAQNDSLLIVSYNDVWGKKKFKWATAGKVIPFKTAAGKIGLVHVLQNDNTDNGYMVMDIKIQQ